MKEIVCSTLLGSAILGGIGLIVFLVIISPLWLKEVMIIATFSVFVVFIAFIVGYAIRNPPGFP